MKRKPSIFTTALNTATMALNSVRGMVSEFALPEDLTQEFRYRLSPYGEFPVTDVRGQNIIQVVDREAGETLAANFGSLRTKFATFFKGIPIYEGHPDDAEWLKQNPGHKAVALGRLKSIELEDDGIWVTGALNSKGIAMLSGEAPEYSGHSPNWRLVEIPGKPRHYRPILLWSDGLTNMPNIMQNTIALNSLQGNPSPDADESGESENQKNNDMKLTPEALQALGFAPDAEPSPEEITAAIIKLASEQAEAKAKMATAEGETTAANSRITLLETEITNIRGIAVESAITEAINTGRITEADKPAWTTALNTSYLTEKAKLDKLMPSINTENKVAQIGRRDLNVTDASNAVDRITQEVKGYAVEKAIDITTAAGWTKAYDACRAAKPEIFARA